MNNLVVKLFSYVVFGLIVLCIVLGGLFYWQQRARILVVLCRFNCRDLNFNRANIGEAESNGISVRALTLDNVYLTGADLRGAYLTGVSFNKTNLLEVKLDDNTVLDSKWKLVWEIVNKGAEGRDLKRVDLSKTYLVKANLYGANLQGANLSESYLIGADLRQSNLEMADLRGSNLIGARLEKYHMYKVIIDETTLMDEKWRLIWQILHQGVEGQDLSGLDLSGLNLREAKLSNVNLNDADLHEADLTKVDLSGARLREVDLHGAILREANLSKADLYDSNFQNANLEGANLREANLVGANLNNANLAGTNLAQANLTATDLTETDLALANLCQVQFNQRTRTDASMRLYLVNKCTDGSYLPAASCKTANEQGLIRDILPEDNIFLCLERKSAKKSVDKMWLITPQQEWQYVTYYRDNGIRVTLDSSWELYFHPPAGQRLMIGDYKNLQNTISSDYLINDNGPGFLLDREIQNGPEGCNSTTRRFEIRELNHNSKGVIERLAINFEDHCLFGYLRLNSRVEIP